MLRDLMTAAQKSRCFQNYELPFYVTEVRFQFERGYIFFVPQIFVFVYYFPFQVLFN